MSLMNDLNIIINGKRYFGIKGETILECAKRAGIEIPTLCNDPRLDPYSSCYVCVVEVEKMKGLQPACSTRINEGMVIHTDNEKVRNARKCALDLIVSNHYADCVAPCKMTCPAGVDVQGYISLIEKGMNKEAVGLIKEVNPLPAICGRVCVRPCEVACRRNLLDEGTGVGIDYLKRYSSDIDLNSESKYIPKLDTSTGKKVAVIGAGPGGLAAAWFLQVKGHKVDIFEASPNPGGMLRYGIPPYRLPNEIIDAEVKNITDLGCDIFYNTKLGKDVGYKDIKSKYDATVLTIGSQKGTGVGCPGDDAGNVFSGIDFLRNLEMTGQKPDFSGKTCAVVGGGNTAMDCCRTAMRLGASKVFVVYRRTEKEMPANPIEIHESKEEGIEYLFLNNPSKINKDENGDIKSISLIKMELGAPDASGRRRPVPIEGSEYDIDVDYVLAAIGQKTQVDFIDDINENTDKGELQINRWGDIDADSKTLQTGVKNIFAAGDGVTGPATLIEAIAQAKIASRSCDQYLREEAVNPASKEFISKKDNFRKQEKEEYQDKYAKQLRQEMPLIPPNKRQNFNEVELGYSDEMAMQETARCLECGCSEYYSCDLKALCDEYGADQEKFSGDYQSYQIKFDHPYIEIDSNKCILCSRCLRVCKDIVGANALGMVNRGFETYVSPSMGDQLADTHCESCGLCISACPTGAITENKTFKPGPVKLDEKTSICSYCSVGCSLVYHDYKGFTFKVTGNEGMVNTEASLCKYGKFAYSFLNDTSRITLPLLKKNGKFVEISFEEAFELINKQIKGVLPDENAFFAGARLSNEELYLVQRLARGAVKTNNINSFLYLGSGDSFNSCSNKNTPFEDIKKASRIYLMGTEIHEENAVAGFMVNQARNRHGIPVSLISVNEASDLEKKSDQVIQPKSYYGFLKALNHYLVSNKKENGLFINDHCEGFKDYQKKVLEENYENWIEISGLDKKVIEDFANQYNKEQNAILLFSEIHISGNEARELKNLALLTGKLGKTASGLICLKEKNNSQGIWDMGITPTSTCGSRDISLPEVKDALRKTWKIEELPDSVHENTLDLIRGGKIKNILIFGEDPVGCAVYREEVETWLNNCEFIVVQDFFMTETANMADLILPSSMAMELNGSFTSTQRTIQEFNKTRESGIQFDSPKQVIEIAKTFGLNGLEHSLGARAEAFSIIAEREPEINYQFINTDNDNYFRFFDHGCDSLVRRFDQEFEQSLLK